MADKFTYSSRDWFGKVSAAIILGFVLSVALTGLFAYLGPGGLMHSSAKTQINMWMIAPIWITILSFCFFFKSSLRAWGWLGLATALCVGVLLIAKSMNGGAA